MDKKDVFVWGCIGLLSAEAAENTITGEKPQLPAGQPHIEVSALPEYMSTQLRLNLGAVATLGSTSNVSTSTGFVVPQVSTGWTNSR